MCRQRQGKSWHPHIRQVQMQMKIAENSIIRITVTRVADRDLDESICTNMERNAERLCRATKLQ